MDMAEFSPSKSVIKVEQDDCSDMYDQKADIKQEVDVNVTVKPEPHECVACTVHSVEIYDIYTTKTIACGVLLHDFLCEFTHIDRIHERSSFKYMCQNCYDLVNDLEQAGLEFKKLKQTFEAIINKNPLLAAPTQPSVDLGVKIEITEKSSDLVDDYLDQDDAGADSEDDPLAVVKKKKYHQSIKRVKKSTTLHKCKIQTRRNTGNRSKFTMSGDCDNGDSPDFVPDDLKNCTKSLKVRKKSPWQLSKHELKHEESGEHASNTAINGTSEWKCDKCDRSFKSKDALQRHKNKHTEKPKFQCDLCDISFIQWRALKNHKLVSHSGVNPYECDVCGLALHSLWNLRRHKGTHNDEKPHKCTVCEKAFSTRYNLLAHSKLHGSSDDAAPKRRNRVFKCPFCQEVYPRRYMLERHVSTGHGRTLEKPPPIPRKRRIIDRDWRCEECNKSFSSKGGLQMHNVIHVGELKYQCDECGKSFLYNSSLKTHKLSHSGVKPYACDVCGLALLTSSHLQRHKRALHGGEKRHECTLCGKKFSERYNLMAHSKSHEGGADAETKHSTTTRSHLFRCYSCQERFPKRFMLERHMATVHELILEKPPATPRNTTSKLLKAQAQAHRERSPSLQIENEIKLELSPDSGTTTET